SAPAAAPAPGPASPGAAVPADARAASATAAAPDVQPDDLRLLIPGVPPGPVTVCVLPFGNDIRDPRLLETVHDFDALEIHCSGIDVPASEPVHRVLVETPAMERPR
ncbi:MAG TPA: hypothetical protein VHE35_06540, partial [Kofleriaceae bacterium]|nr:hypothetical protein [Kofleriaceae bacterium]